MGRKIPMGAILAVAAAVALWACQDQGPGPQDQVGGACMANDECFAGVAQRDQIPGEIRCLDRVTDGYCTHTCTKDADCCAVPGECPAGITQVCAPFESTGLSMCFLSCEAQDIGDGDATLYCQQEVHSEFGCRSTGGGSNNRKVCVP